MSFPPVPHRPLFLMAIIYALCCLAFAAVNDFLFKLFARHSQASRERSSCGLFVSVVGAVEVAVVIWFQRSGSHLWTTLLWGCISGLLSVVSNILVIESMRFLAAGVSSTIFRLNLVLVVIGGVCFLGEPVHPTLILGVVAAGLAVLAFIPQRSQNTAGNRPQLGFALAVSAAVIRAVMSLSYKVAFSRGADVNAVTLINGLCWVFGGLLFALLRDHRLPRPNSHDLVTALVSGIFVSGIIVFMARMNACGNASVVNPIAQMSFLGTFILSAVFLKEAVTRRKLAAMALGIMAILLLTL